MIRNLMATLFGSSSGNNGAYKNRATLKFEKKTIQKKCQIRTGRGGRAVCQILVDAHSKTLV